MTILTPPAPLSLKERGGRETGEFRPLLRVKRRSPFSSPSLPRLFAVERGPGGEVRPLSLVGLTLLMTLSTSGTAHADAIPGTVLACPAGSTARVSHAGPYCAPPAGICVPGSHWAALGPGQSFCVRDRVCKDDADCTGDTRCSPIPQCASSVEVESSRDLHSVVRVDGTCASSSSCTAPAACEIERFCLEDPTKLEAKRHEEEEALRKKERAEIKVQFDAHEAGNAKATRIALIIIAAALVVFGGVLTFMIRTRK